MQKRRLKPVMGLPSNPVTLHQGMFDILKSMFSESSANSDSLEAFAANDQRLAEAALMFHVIAVDGEITPEERSRMDALLGSLYDLSEEQLVDLYERAEKADRDSVDFYRFTSLLKKKLDRDQRIGVIERLWELVFADGKIHEFEDNVVWRIAQLLEVETPDRIAMKQRVRKRRAEAETK